MPDSDPIPRNNVTVSGKSEARTTLVFVCGLGTDQTCWDGVAQAFADDFRIVTFDNVGAVASNQEVFRTHTSRYLNIKGYASDLLEICAALRLGPSTVFVGHSMGAMACMIASVAAPVSCSRLVLLGASPRYANAPGYVGGFTKDDIDATYEAATKSYLDWTRYLAAMVIPNPQQRQLAERFAEALLRVPQDMMLTILCSILQADRREELHSVTKPALIIQARDDFFVPAAVAEHLRVNLRESELCTIDAAGHLPHLTAPAKVVAAMQPFLASLI